jgi:hypothetical protein
MIIMMRTTLNLPDDVYRMAVAVAAAKGTSLGNAVAELVRRGLQPAAAITEDGGFPCFAVPPEAAPISLAQTLAAEDEL